MNIFLYEKIFYIGKIIIKFCLYPVGIEKEITTQVKTVVYFKMKDTCLNKQENKIF